MAPRIIADSEDESDAEQRLSPPLQRRGDPLRPTSPVVKPAPTRSSDQESLATVSTDPIYFQRIYHDQQEAARERSRNLRSAASGPSKEGSHRSSLLTTSGTDEHRAVKGQQNSSFTSATEPNVERYRDMFSEGREDGNAPTAGASDASDGSIARLRPMESSGDPWTLPSTCEMPRMDTSQHDPADNDVSVLSNHDALVDHEAPRDHKARRTRKQKQKSKQPLTLESDGANLHASLDKVETGIRSAQEKATVFSIPVPGPGLQRDALSAPDTPEQGKSITIQDSTEDVAQSSVLRRRNLLPQQQTLYSAGPNGAGTNINSPCNFSVSISSDAFESLGVPMIVDKIAMKTREYGSLGHGIHSSPDAIAYEAQEGPENPTLAIDHNDDGEAAALSVQGPCLGLQPGSDGNVAQAERVEQPVEKPATKKRRGRPKKGENQSKPERDPTVSPALEVHAVVQDPPKKRRGRPKRQALMQTSDKIERDQGEAAPQASPQAVVTIFDQEKIAGSDVENNDQEEGAATRRKKRRQESPQRGLEEPAEPNTRTVSLAKESAQTAPPLSRTARPAYRVGLSKRSKVPPLLKIVRK